MCASLGGRCLCVGVRWQPQFSVPTFHHRLWDRITLLFTPEQTRLWSKSPQAPPPTLPSVHPCSDMCFHTPLSVPLLYLFAVFGCPWFFPVSHLCVPGLSSGVSHCSGAPAPPSRAWSQKQELSMLSAPVVASKLFPRLSTLVCWKS